MKVLVIDDNQVNVTMLKHLVNKIDDCSAVCFTSSPEALNWSKENEIDLVLVDYMMPEIDGLEFIRRFKSIEGQRDIPIIVVTGEQEKAIRYQALELGTNDFLTKPVDKTEFTARARNMLAIRRHQKELSDRAAWLQKEVKKATAEIRTREKEAIFCLSEAAEFRDPETGAHIQRIAYYCEHIAKQLGLSAEEQEINLLASPMHDVGKVGIPDSILLKPDKLTIEEVSVMVQHTIIGYSILKESSSALIQIAAQIALSHHEKYDGTGYPHRLKAGEIPLVGRIAAVADVFDALTSERPYKKAWDVESAIKHIQDNSGGHFDHECVQAFLKNWENVLKIKARYSL